MKRTLMIIAIGMVAHTGYAQGMFDKVKSQATSEVKKEQGSMTEAQAAKVKDQILGKLAPTLKLTDGQKTSVGNAIQNFLTQKAAAQTTASTDKAASDSKVSDLKSQLMTTLKSQLNKEQFAKLLKMKPAAGDKTNPLSAIF